MTDSEPYNEKDLLLRVAVGDEEAFRAIFMHYRGRLYDYMLKITGSPETAEDTVHDVFLKIWENRSALLQVQNFGSYIFRAARNQSITGFRRMATETLVLAELQHRRVEALETVDPAAKKEIRAFIQAAVDRLSPQQRKVFILSRQDGLRHEEIAEQLGISVNTVNFHLGAALRFLRAEIAQTYGPLAIAIYVIYQLS